MLTTLARAAQALAIWRAAEAGDTQETTNPADLKSAAARAHEMFISEAYGIAFDLVPWLLASGEITTQSEVRYLAHPAGGGFVIQKMNLDPNNPGIRLEPSEASAQNFLQLIIDLPELLEALKVKQ